MKHPVHFLIDAEECQFHADAQQIKPDNLPGYVAKLRGVVPCGQYDPAHGATENPENVTCIACLAAGFGDK